MATRLLDAGVVLSVADINAAALEPFAARGVATAERAGTLPGDVVITSLPADAHVREALLAPGGALERRRTTVIDMSSSRPTETKRLAEELSARGIAVLDAPVSGGVPGARSGRLVTMVGGAAEDVERYRSLLGVMCATVTRVGEVGAGHTMKALNNYLSSVALWSGAEALVIGARCGLDPRTMVEVWGKGTARSHAMEVKIPLAMLPRTFDYGFTIGLLAKDLAIAAGVARDAEVEAPMLLETEAHWKEALNELGGATDYTAVIKLIERWARFEVPAAVRPEEA